MRERVERAVEEIERLFVAQVDEASALVEMIDGLRASEERVVLDGARGEAADVVRELLELRERAATAKVAQVIRDRAPRRLAGERDFVSDQIADVRHDPVLARLDEPVLVELGDVFLDEVHLLGDRAQQIAQRVAMFLVALAIDDRKEVEQAVDVHERSP